MKLHRKRNNQIALTRESRPYIIKSRASFLEQGRKRWKDGLKRISCIYVTVVNMSRQDVIMSLLQIHHVAKMIQMLQICHSLCQYTLRWKSSTLRGKSRTLPDGNRVVPDGN